LLAGRRGGASAGSGIARCARHRAGSDSDRWRRRCPRLRHLAGGWDFTLYFSDAAVVGAQSADPNGGISLADAIDKQLGLKLELQKRPVKVLVIDHINEKPADN